MRLDIPCSHAFGIHGENLFLNVLAYTGLIFLEYLRLEFTLAVTRNRYLHIAVAGSKRFAAVSVAAVVGIFVSIVVPSVAQLVIQLCLKTVLHELRDSLLKQILDVIHAADVAA